MNPVFLSDGGLGVRIAATGTSQAVLLVGDGDSVLLTNPGSTTVYIRLGRSDVVATTACYPILPDTKEDEIMLKGADGGAGLRFQGGTWIAAICESGQTGTLVAHRVSR